MTNQTQTPIYFLVLFPAFILSGFGMLLADTVGNVEVRNLLAVFTIGTAVFIICQNWIDRFCNYCYGEEETVNTETKAYALYSDSTFTIFENFPNYHGAFESKSEVERFLIEYAAMYNPVEFTFTVIELTTYEEIRYASMRYAVLSFDMVDPAPIVCNSYEQAFWMLNDRLESLQNTGKVFSKDYSDSYVHTIVELEKADGLYTHAWEKEKPEEYNEVRRLVTYAEQEAKEAERHSERTDTELTRKHAANVHSALVTIEEYVEYPFHVARVQNALERAQDAARRAMLDATGSESIELQEGVLLDNEAGTYSDTETVERLQNVLYHVTSIEDGKAITLVNEAPESEPEAIDDQIRELIDAINEYAPEGYYVDYIEDHPGVIGVIKEDADEESKLPDGFIQVVLLAVFASALINIDTSGLDREELETFNSIQEQYGYAVDVSEGYYGYCEYTELYGDVAEYTFYEA